MSKSKGKDSVEDTISNKRQKVDNNGVDKVQDKDGVGDEELLCCNKCDHKPCLWQLYGKQAKECMSRKVEELESTVSSLNDRRSKARNAGYTMLSNMCRPSLHRRQELPECLVDAVRQFMPAVDGNDYKGFKK